MNGYETPYGDMRITTGANGPWTVEAEWYGRIRAVFTADAGHHPMIQLQDCLSYVIDAQKGNG